MIYENFPAAYGEYNEMTIEVANARNQKLVNWDFEYELFLCSPHNFFSLLTFFFFPVCSSGDSTGVEPENQKKLYDDIVEKKLNNVLSLQHEVYGKFLGLPFFFFFAEP